MMVLFLISCLLKEKPEWNPSHVDGLQFWLKGGEVLVNKSGLKTVPGNEPQVIEPGKPPRKLVIK